jgi:hypothetical protein
MGELVEPKYLVDRRIINITNHERLQKLQEGFNLATGEHFSLDEVLDMVLDAYSNIK